MNTETCSVAGCQRPVRCREVCGRHYRKLLLYGDPTVNRAPTKGLGLEERLAFYVDRSGGADACWPFNGARHIFGYGSMWDAELGRPDGAHRIAWKLEYGPVPDGLEVLHRCDNAACCNPEHLFLGTQKVNMRDMIAKGRRSHANKAAGEANGLSRLTLADVRMIRRLAAQGKSHRSLGHQFGVAHSTVDRIVNRSTWRHSA